ncbi:MAG: UbiA prenyltransferase family protein [Kiritimatiellia bacterium]
MMRRIRSHLVALRPHQWTKNSVVAAAYVFALGDRHQTLPANALWITLAITACFCLASSAIYLVNDVRDIELDRLHPTKRFRPIAAGQVRIPTALLMSAALAATALAVSRWIQPLACLPVAAYLVKQLGYSMGLKRIAYLDVILIATGFVLRALGGALALGPDVSISHWLLICTFLLALFLGFSKRRHEKVTLGGLKDNARPSLRQVDEKTLDSVILLAAGATLTAYALYTIAPETVAKFGSRKLAWTIPFVAMGLWRYFHLVYRREEGGRPERVLLTDPAMIGILAAYTATILALIT